MSVLFIVIPLAILLAFGALVAFFWAVHRGQYDDLDTPPMSVLFDDADAARRPELSREKAPARQCRGSNR